MTVISDTPLLFHALKNEREGLFLPVFETGPVSPAAQKEQPPVQHLFSCDRAPAQPVTERRLATALPRMAGIGEPEAVASSFDKKTDYLPVDERRGTGLALRLQLRTVGFSGFLAPAKEAGRPWAVKPLGNRPVTETSFRYTGFLLKQTLQKANES